MSDRHHLFCYLVLLITIQCIYADSHNDGETCIYGGYSHPDWWCSTLCADAPDESPIDIDTDDVQDDDDKCTGKLDWDIDWDHTYFQVENNCHTLQVTPMGFGDADILTPFNDYRRKIAVLNSKNTPFDEEYDEYCLAQFHFHWGSDSSLGSEHLVDGKRFPLEIHFVHYACEYGTFTKAQEQGSLSATQRDIDSTLDDDDDSTADDVDHTLAVVAYFFEISEDDNPAFDIILSDYLKEEIKNCSVEGNEVIIENAILDDIIPDDLELNGYWAYKGSLTTPPCTDDVNWFVMKTHGYISEQQIERFRELLDDEQEEITRNWRDTQEKENPVYDCGDEYVDNDDNGNGDNDDDGDNGDIDIDFGEIEPLINSDLGSLL